MPEVTRGGCPWEWGGSTSVLRPHTAPIWAIEARWGHPAISGAGCKAVGTVHTHAALRVRSRAWGQAWSSFLLPGVFALWHWPWPAGGWGLE